MREPVPEPTADTTSDEALMAAYAQGDQAAFGLIFARNAPLLTRVVRAQVGSDDECRDIVQQTFLQLHRARRDYHEGEPLRPWLLTIAYNLCRDRWRTRGRHREIPIEQATPPVELVTAADLLQERQRANRLHEAMASLPVEQRRVIEMHWFTGLSLPEVATAVGASLSAVKVRAHRGYEHLRRQLARAKDV